MRFGAVNDVTVGHPFEVIGARPVPQLTSKLTGLTTAAGRRHWTFSSPPAAVWHVQISATHR